MKEQESSVTDIGNNMEEALSALQVLGYQKKEAQNALGKIQTQDMSVEELIKRALNILSK